MADNLRARNKAPEAAVITYVTVVAHGKVAIRRYNDVVSLNMRRQFLRPFVVSYSVCFRWRLGREVIRVRVVLLAFVADERVPQSLTGLVDDIIAEGGVVAGDAHDPVYHEQNPVFLRHEHSNLLAV